MKIEALKHDFTVCKVAELSDVDLTSEFCFVGKTDEELSLVCLTSDAPTETLAREDGWCAFRIVGTLDFALVGILAKIASLMAENNIGIFAVSTYNTDYVLVKAEHFPRALDILAENGYEVIR